MSGSAQPRTRGRDASVRTAAHELEELAVSPAQIIATEGHWDFFCQWTRAHGRECLPASAQTVALFLYSQRDYWGWASSRKAADSIRRAHEWAGLANPAHDPLVVRYLTAVARTQGRRVEQRTSPLRASDVIDILAVPMTRKAGVQCAREAVCRAALVLGRDANAPLRQLARLRPEDLVFSSNMVEVSLPACPAGGKYRAIPGRVVRLHRSGTALCPVAVCADLIARRPALATLLLDANPRFDGSRQNSSGDVKKAIKSMLRSVARRAWLPDQWAAACEASVVSEWRAGGCRGSRSLTGEPHFGAGLGEREFERMTAFCNLDLLMQMRDRMYLLTGVALCRRHAELRGMRRRHLRRCAGGLEVTIPESKNPQPRDSVIYLERTDGPACPVRWLDAWLRMLDDAGYGDQDTYLFPALERGQVVGQLPASTGQMCRRLQRFAKVLDESAEDRVALGRPRRIGTRSARVGGIQSLSESGANAAQIAEVSLHRNMEQLAVYLRFEDPLSSGHHLAV